MNLILTNDDGLGEPGLEALYQAVAGLGARWVVAPDGPRSGCGHAVTTDRGIRFERREEGRIAVAGTPVDCVRLALSHFRPEASWVLSGINAGGNLGADVYVSGTVAAVREAAFFGTPGVALSQYVRRDRPLDWGRVGAWTTRVLGALLDRSLEPGTFWNVNFPHPGPEGPEPEIVFCPLDRSPHPVRYRVEGDFAHYVGDYHSRPRQPGTDVDVCFRGDIAVSLVRL